jgi:hypothetical protein
MKFMAKLNHPNVQNLVGVCICNGVQIISELREGSLLSYLSQNQAILSFINLIHYCVQIASVNFITKLAKHPLQTLHYSEGLVTNSKFQAQLSRKLQRFRTCRKNKKWSIFHDLSEYIIFFIWL